SGTEGAAPAALFLCLPVKGGASSRAGGLAFSPAGDLLEALAEVELEVVVLGPAEVRRAKDVGHGKERMVRRHRLLVVDVERGVARPPVPQRFEQGAGLDQLGARRVDEKRARLHAPEVLARHAAARLGREPYLQREDVRLLEELS